MKLFIGAMESNYLSTMLLSEIMKGIATRHSMSVIQYLNNRVEFEKEQDAKETLCFTSSIKKSRKYTISHVSTSSTTFCYHSCSPRVSSNFLLAQSLAICC